MNTTEIFLTEDEFAAIYPLTRNPFDSTAGWGTGEDGESCLFEIYGEEFAFVQQQDPATVWTFEDAEDDQQLVVSGLHYVNRIGYLISSKPVPQGTSVVVQLGTPSPQEVPHSRRSAGHVSSGSRKIAPAAAKK